VAIFLQIEHSTPITGDKSTDDVARRSLLAFGRRLSTASNSRLTGTREASLTTLLFKANRSRPADSNRDGRYWRRATLEILAISSLG